MLRNVAQENSVECVDVVCLPLKSEINEVKSPVSGSTLEQASLKCKGFISKLYNFFFVKFRIGKSTSVLLTLQIPALDPLFSNHY
jgi:hypothetical protein